MAAGAAIVALDSGSDRVAAVALDRPTVLGPELGLDREIAIAPTGRMWRVTATAGDLDDLGTPERGLADGTAFFVGHRRFRFVASDDLPRALADEAYLRTALDGLTGLYSRGFLVAHAPRLRPPCAVVAGDLDWFMAFNDRHGHLIGDRVLAAVGERLAAHVRWPELVARYGGEELAIVLPGATLDAARARAEQIRIAMTEPIPLGLLEPVSLTISLGIAMLRPEPGAFWTAVRDADDAVMRAKRQGRNRVV